MERERLRELLYEKYIAPTQKVEQRYVGVEIEMPVVNLRGSATEHHVTKAVFADFIRDQGFIPQGEDRYGFCYTATEPVTGDNISFDCSYNNLELSFGREQSIGPIAVRFRRYVEDLNRRLAPERHTLTGLGVNPNYHANRKDYLHVPRYQMLEGYLRRAAGWRLPMYFHPYAGFGTYASASQVQIDVKSGELITVLRAQSLLEPVKAVLFDNACMDEEPELLCVRDLFWENSTHGINPPQCGYVRGGSRQHRGDAGLHYGHKPFLRGAGRKLLPLPADSRRRIF